MKIVVSYLSASNLLLLKNEKEIEGDKCCRIVVKSQAAAMARSVDNITGINNYVEYHVKISAMNLVAFIHTHTR